MGDTSMCYRNHHRQADGGKLHCGRANDARFARGRFGLLIIEGVLQALAHVKPGELWSRA